MAEDFSFKRVTFATNTVIFEEGRRGKAAYLIVDGAVEIRKGTRSKNPIVLATRGKCDVIGEMALFDDRPHMAEAVAVAQTHAMAISREEFNRRVESMDPVMRGIALMMTQRMRQLADLLIEAKGNINWSEWTLEE